jgi:hypothetical protein
MMIDQYRTEQFIDEADRAAYFRMIQREAYRYDSERDAQRKLEDEIIEMASQTRPGLSDIRTAHLREVAAQIRDHREAGHYTTMHR